MSAVPGGGGWRPRRLGRLTGRASGPYPVEAECAAAQLDHSGQADARRVVDWSVGAECAKNFLGAVEHEDVPGDHAKDTVNLILELSESGRPRGPFDRPASSCVAPGCGSRVWAGGHYSNRNDSMGSSWAPFQAG